MSKSMVSWPRLPLLPTKGDETTDVVLRKLLRAHGIKASAVSDMLRKNLHAQRVQELLPEEALRGATDMEGGKARCNRVHHGMRHRFRHGTVPWLVQVKTCRSQRRPWHDQDNPKKQ
jgi:hypothetical protein